MKILLMSTPIGTLGSGAGGGIEFTITNVARDMQQRGHQVTVIAAAGSQVDGLNIETVAGSGQISVQTQTVDTPVILPPNSVLANMWQRARDIQQDYDVIVNYAYDWLPFYLTYFFETPVAHHVSMSFLTEAIDQAIAPIAAQNPERLKFGSRAQAQTFSFDASQCPVIYHGLPLEKYQFSAKPKNQFIWLGRIAPEKALEDAVQVAQMTGIPLKIFGKLEDEQYWQAIQTNFPDAPIEYGGFLSDKGQLQQIIGASKALLMTPRWVEAFGNVVIESLACGTPVITYDRGGPAEIIQDGQTGFVVEPDNISALVRAVGKLDQIERSRCRQIAETEFSLKVMGDRLEAWFKQLITG